MRIAYLSVSDQLGGSEIALVEMIRGLRRQRPSWRPLVILPGRGPLLDRVRQAGGDAVVLPLPSSLARIGEAAGADAGWPLLARAALGLRLAAVAAAMPGYQRRLANLIRTNRVDLLHTNGLKAHVLGARAAGRTPIVWHMHEYIARRPVTRRLLARHAARCSMVLTNSRSVADDVRGVLGEGVPVRIVRNAVDIDAFSPTGAAADLDRLAGFPAPSGPVVRIGLVATFGRWKGHEVFVRALAALPPGLTVRGYVIGAPLYDTTGSQWAEAELRELVRRAGADGRVGLTGYVPASHAMRALDIVVHASTQPEPFGLVIAEAMASGRALVTSALGGAAELVEPGVDAETHAAGDPASLARVLAKLVTDPTHRAALAARAQAAARTRFDPDRFAAALVGVYETLVRSGATDAVPAVREASTTP
jgi:glycosyltransferase involved in cell wall biosynthesis